MLGTEVDPRDPGMRNQGHFLQRLLEQEVQTRHKSFSHKTYSEGSQRAPSVVQLEDRIRRN